MRRSASEIINDLEVRIARLERQASSLIEVSSGLVESKKEHIKQEKMTVGELLRMLQVVRKSYKGKCAVKINPRRTEVKFFCGSGNGQWSASVDMYDLINAIEKDDPKEMKALFMNANVMDDGDADGMAFALEDWFASRGSFGRGGMGTDWSIEVI